MVTIVDYKVGNLGSIQNMLKKIKVKSIITSDSSAIQNAEKLILPGVGAFDSGVDSLKSNGLWDILNEKVLVNKTPILGICLGAQLICQSSEEGQEEGFGWINAEVKRFNFSDNTFKIPHIGWNYTKLVKDSKLFTNMYDDPKFYFVHSFYMDVKDDTRLLKTIYKNEFDSGFENGNVLGVQFHPEKSHKYGMKLLENFVEYY